MHPLRLNSPFSATPESAPRSGIEQTPATRRRGGLLSQVSKGLAAFVVGVVIGASTILLAEAITPAHGEAGALDGGPVQLRR